MLNVFTRLLGCRVLVTAAPLRQRGYRCRLYVPDHVLSRNPVAIRLFGPVCASRSPG